MHAKHEAFTYWYPDGNFDGKKYVASLNNENGQELMKSLQRQGTSLLQNVDDLCRVSDLSRRDLDK